MEYIAANTFLQLQVEAAFYLLYYAVEIVIIF